MGTTRAIRTQQKKARLLSLLLCLLMLLGSVAELAACTSGDTTETVSTAPSGTEQTTDVPSSAAATQGEPEETTEPETESSAAEDTSADTSEDTSAETKDATESETAEIETSGEADRKGKEFRILSATRAPDGMASSNCFLEGEQNTAGTINEAVHERNTAVELELDAALTFSHADADKSDIQSEIKRLVMSGTDAYDLVISELLPFASLANDGTFRNILSSEFTGFDFENKPYWYKEYMDDLRLVNGYEYLLAGDFFIDVLRSSHLLLFNKEMYRDHYRRDPGEVFEWVLNYEWTYEKLNGIITDMYLDKNGNSRRDYGDRWGLSISDLRLQNGYEYILAGDFFIDVLRSSHLLLFNKGMYQDHYQRDPNEVYDWVLNYEWTYEKMNQMITDMYDDKNRNGLKDYGDQWGISVLELWGSSIGFVVSANPGFITRDEDGTPYPALGENSRGEDLTDWLYKIVYNDSACFGITSDAKILQDFTEGLSLICDYQRLGSLENTILLSMQGEAGVLPCPMLYASDKQYNTATHDTTEVGAIMTTAKDAEFISTVIQVLNRETASLLIPKYYGEALQVQYVTDPYASKMVQIIHDNIRESFILAYNNWTGSIMLNVFSNAVSGKRSFSAMYNARSSRNMQTNMNRMIKAFKRYNKIL